MKLTELVKVITPQQMAGVGAQEIQGLYYDSRSVQPGGLFFALRGVAVDGHRFIPAALALGAVAVVVEDPALVPAGTPFIQVADARLAMARMAAHFYG